MLGKKFVAVLMVVGFGFAWSGTNPTRASLIVDPDAPTSTVISPMKTTSTSPKLPESSCTYLGNCGPFLTDTAVIWLADMTYNPNTGTMYMLEVGGPNGIIVWDPQSCQISGYLMPPWSTSQRGIAYDPMRDLLYVGGWNEQLIYVIDPSTGNILDTLIPPPNLANIAGLAYDMNCDLIWIITNSVSDSLGAIDPTTGSLSHGPVKVNWTTPSSYSGAGLAWGPPGFLLAVNQQAQEIEVLDADGNSQGTCSLSTPVVFGWGIGHEWNNQDLWVTNAYTDFLTHNFTIPSFSPFPWFCPPPCPPVFDHLVLFFDFNECDFNFFSYAPSINCVNDWRWGMYDSFQPPQGCEEIPITNYWGTIIGGMYSNNSGSRLVSPPIDVGENYWLEICHWYDIEHCYDGGNVKISTDNGATWTIIYPCSGYPQPSTSSLNCFIANEPAFSGSSLVWVQDYFDLTVYDGQTILIAFDFGSDGTIMNPGWYIKWVRIWTTGITDVAEDNVRIIPELFEPKPNPTSGTAELSFVISKASDVSLSIFDATGRLVKTLEHGKLEAGTHTYMWDGTNNMGSESHTGIYFVRLTANKRSVTKKLILVK